jgi:hypothetical protein
LLLTILRADSRKVYLVKIQDSRENMAYNTIEKDLT